MSYPYIAQRPIRTLDGVLAFAPGDSVPEEHLKTLGLEVGVDVVAREDHDPALLPEELVVNGQLVGVAAVEPAEGKTKTKA